MMRHFHDEERQDKMISDKISRMSDEDLERFVSGEDTPKNKPSGLPWGQRMTRKEFIDELFKFK